MKLTKTLSLFFGSLMLLFTIIFPWNQALAQQQGYSGWGMGPGMMMGNWGMGWFGGIFMMIFWVLILVGLGFFIKWLVQSTNRGQAGGNNDNRALEILKERYARGEIDNAEFEAKRKDLLR